MCAMWLCAYGIIFLVRCPVLQWKHPGFQLRWSQVRTPLPGSPATHPNHSYITCNHKVKNDENMCEPPAFSSHRYRYRYHQCAGLADHNALRKDHS